MATTMNRDVFHSRALGLEQQEREAAEARLAEATRQREQQEPTRDRGPARDYYDGLSR